MGCLKLAYGENGVALRAVYGGKFFDKKSCAGSKLDVFFDNLQVTHTRGPLLSESHYYPHGLEMKALSSRSAGTLVNKRLFNGGNELQTSEFSDGTGLDMYDAMHRTYDQQLGIFRQIDPLSDLSLRFSPYAFANNNPISFNDPLGLIADSTDKKGNVWHGLDDVSVKGTRKKKPQAFHWPSSTQSQRQEWDKNENTYWNRYLNHQPLSQKGDPSSYTSKLGMYNRWSLEGQNYRAMQSWAVGVMATPVLISISPGVIFTALRMKLQANLVAAGADFGIQALVNGSNHRSIINNWNPVSTGLSFGIGTPTHSLGNIAGVSLLNATFSSSINLSIQSRLEGSVLSFDARGILINAAFGTAGGAMGNQLKVDFRNLSLGEGASQTINLTGAVVDDKTKNN